MKNNISFNKLHDKRREFLRSNRPYDHKIIEGTSSTLISVPHGVSQVRLGKLKSNELGSLATALFLKENTDCFLIAKTRNNNDDANFDDISEYKESLKNLIINKNLKYIIDFHSLASKRECDINLGINFGKNIEYNVQLFDLLCSLLKNNNFKISIDDPFMGGPNTISGTMKDVFDDIFTLQIEINGRITNNIENVEKYAKLLYVLLDWIKTIPNKK